MKKLSEDSLWTAVNIPMGLNGLERLARFLGLPLPAPKDTAYRFKLIRSIQREEKRIEKLPISERWNRNG